MCMSELEVHSFPIAKQLLCLPGFHMFTESKGYISHRLLTDTHPFICDLLCAVHLKPQLPRPFYLNGVRNAFSLLGFGCMPRWSSYVSNS